jgi:transketolase
MTTERFMEKPLGYKLAELGERYENLVMVDADLRRVTESYIFKERFPERCFDVGVAEANMVGLAVGLALSGKIAFCGTLANFMTQRVCDQVAISVAYCQANVKMLGFDAALASGRNGASHQGMLDLAIMRAMPNMTVLVPGDATEIHAILEYIVEHPGPVYMRSPRYRAPVILDPDTYHFEPGKAVQLRDGSDVAIIACGIMLPRALQALDELAAEGISARVINMSSVKPLDEEMIIRAAGETGCIVTAENHNILGGLGSAVAEVVTSHCPVPVIRVGIHDVFGEVGPADWLAEKHGISASHIVQAAREALDHRRRIRNAGTVGVH